ncbi:hypothetical protein HF086_014352 [Spodoptera exigua]|uniref:Uncharacterized protein n=1 Tax=Spodoptera exigua TaxID=7107 RepID=A0A922SBX1_SPOEX|nr:hypothetical protein HF086_014352 [Spodoptera exigua]
MDKVKLFWSKTNRWHRGLFVLLLVELRVFPGGQLGFLCNDPALSHPFNGDTISWKWLLATSIFLPLIVMLIVERKYHNEKPSQSKLAVDWFKEYLYGLLLNLLIVETLKIRYLCNNFECTSDGTTTENPISIETKIVNVPLINAKET